MTTRRDFMLGIAAAGALPLAKGQPAKNGTLEPFVGEHVYFLCPGDSYSIDCEATDQWQRSKKVTVIIEEIVPGDVAVEVQKKIRDRGRMILRKPKHGG